jgi:hypothetical protein
MKKYLSNGTYCFANNNKLMPYEVQNKKISNTPPMSHTFTGELNCPGNF